MGLSSLKYLFKEGIKGIWRNRIMGIISVGSVTASLLVLGLFLIVAVNVDNASKAVEDQITVEVFLLDEIDEVRVFQIGETLKSMDNVQGVRYVSKEEALEKMVEAFGDKKYLLEIYKDDHPFPRSYVIKPIDLESIDTLADEINNIEGIEEVKTGTEVVRKIVTSTYFLRISLLTIILILAFVSIFIISNTIKLSVVSRRKEINIMKYIGATDAFIKVPFFIEGMILGFIGSLLAVLILGYGYKSIINFANQEFYSLFAFYLIPFEKLINDLTSLLIALGVGIGAMGSVFSIRKFLKV